MITVNTYENSAPVVYIKVLKSTVSTNCPMEGTNIMKASLRRLSEAGPRLKTVTTQGSEHSTLSGIGEFMLMSVN